MSPYVTSDRKNSPHQEAIAQEKSTPAPAIADPLKTNDDQKEDSKTPPDISPITPPLFEVFTQTTDEEGVCSTESKKQTPSPTATKMTNQELLDTALDYCQASNDYWEQGDLDNALDALDEAYSLILKVNRGDDPELLRQKEDLRFTISKRIIEIYSSRFTVANGYHKAIPLVMNKHVERALELFKGKEKSFFLAAYRRSGKYRPAIAKAFAEAGLPEELSWLPLIESGFKIRALSKARALGLWQFVASTGYKYGLKRNLLIDERMDPEKSTQAAIAYLKELHQIFGDWTTVLAAYNCGEWRVLERIRSQRINYLDNFWDLYENLPRETAFYVPKFLAVLHILNNPEAQGFDLPALEEEARVDKVTINKQVHLKTIAERLGIDYRLLEDLNPELRHQSTPNHPYTLKVPEGKGDMLLAQLADIPIWQPPEPSYVVHRVRPGESLSLISYRYNTSVRAIVAMNGLRNRNFLRVGWQLKIPTKNRFSSPAKRPPIIRPNGESVHYVVRRGDSLWEIADRFQTTTQAIHSMNGLDNSTLQVGQILLIPTPQDTINPIDTMEYRVREGDSPYLIAKRHQMDLAEFLKLNNLTPRSTIFPGQVVRIRAD